MLPEDVITKVRQEIESNVFPVLHLCDLMAPFLEATQGALIIN